MRSEPAEAPEAKECARCGKCGLALMRQLIGKADGADEPEFDHYLEGKDGAEILPDKDYDSAEHQFSWHNCNDFIFNNYNPKE